MSRPERTAAAQAFYDPAEAAKYSASARMGRTQRHLAERALHLLDIRQPGALLLDLGCGTGYSGAPLERAGHAWVGLDLSESMLRAARAPGKRRDVLCADLGAPLWLRRRVFDGAVSISAVQWLCHATANGHDPAKRVRTFFRGLKAVLVPGARAVLQLYPEQPEHMGEREGRARGEREGSASRPSRGSPRDGGPGLSLRPCPSAAAQGCFETRPSPPASAARCCLARCHTGGTVGPCSPLGLGTLVVDYPRSERSKKLFLVLTSPNQAAAAAGGRRRAVESVGGGGGAKGGGGAGKRRKGAAAPGGGGGAKRQRAAADGGGGAKRKGGR